MAIDMRKEAIRIAKKQLNDVVEKFFFLHTIGLIDTNTWENHISFDLANMSGLLSALEDNLSKENSDSGL